MPPPAFGSFRGPASWPDAANLLHLKDLHPRPGTLSRAWQMLIGTCLEPRCPEPGGTDVHAMADLPRYRRSPGAAGRVRIAPRPDRRQCANDDVLPDGVPRSDSRAHRAVSGPDARADADERG